MGVGCYNKRMLFPELIRWWYGPGWRDQASLLGERLAGIADRYSIELLVGSLFAPFRQIDAGPVRGGLDVQVRAWLDRLVSRFIGALIRSVLVVVGIIIFVVNVALGVVWLGIWPALPLLPVVGLLLSVTGWLPWRAHV